MDNYVADIPSDLKRHDAFCFTMLNYKEKAKEMAALLIEEKERRKHNG